MTVPGFDEPEGTRELYVANADGSDARRLTVDPKDESGPSWDPSGNRIGYMRTPGGMLQFLGIEGEVMEMNADGTCPIEVALPKPKAKGWRPPFSRPPGAPAKAVASGRSAAERGEDPVGDAAVGGDVRRPVGADLDQAGAGGEGGREVGEGFEAAVGEVEEGGGALDGDGAGGAEERLELVRRRGPIAGAGSGRCRRRRCR